MNPSSSKRKIDFVTIDKAESQKKCNTLKDDDDKFIDLVNFQLFSDESDPKNKEANIMLKSYIDVFVSKFSEVPSTSQKSTDDKQRQSLRMLINAIGKLKEKSSKIFFQKHISNLFTSFSGDIQKSSSLELVIQNNFELILEIQRLCLLNSSNGTDSIITNDIRIKKAERHSKAINSLRKEINDLESTELNIEDWGSYRNLVNNISNLKKNLVKLWYSRERLLNRSTETWSNFYRGFTYKDLLKEWKDRRMKDWNSSILSIEFAMEEDSNIANNDNDPELLKKLEKNEEEGNKNLISLVEKYKCIDFEKNGKIDNSSLDWNEKSDDDDNDEDDDYDSSSEKSDSDNSNEENSNDENIDLINPNENNEIEQNSITLNKDTMNSKTMFKNDECEVITISDSD
ncbi:hypothetical protein RDWZM_001932 [Blomia tropicalis]|uniref:Uncharacterized protein n=1 Tax=Blomia tropicalis TaxID=40697 RepID=A0A9Q0MD34_BLOTA|nr:hypothetical protein RDWZM_001932 [Blomia tropicalis]